MSWIVVVVTFSSPLLVKSYADIPKIFSTAYGLTKLLICPRITKFYYSFKVIFACFSPKISHAIASPPLLMTQDGGGPETSHLAEEAEGISRMR